MRLKYAPAVIAVGLAALAAGILTTARAQLVTTRQFARQIQELSEPGGAFDTDNLISNERSFLHVVPDLKRAGVAGGVYIGVGPDQNFSYIAAARPSVAFIVDVRRDNLLLHLLFKALFEISDSRAEYLSHLFGRRLPNPPDQWKAAGLERIAAQLDAEMPHEDDVQALQRQVHAHLAQFGVPLSSEDLAAIDRFHRAFISAGLSLKFRSYGRQPQPYYPTYRELLFETDLQGRPANFLIAEDDYQFVIVLQQRDLVIPVVGNLAGPSAVASVGRAIRQRGEQVSVFYVSNVELYLFQDGIFPRYAETLGTLPRNPRSVLVRSIFMGRGVGATLDSKPGYASASVTQRVDDFLADYAAHKYTNYQGLLTAQGNNR